MLHRQSAPCVFPFNFHDAGNDQLVTHTSCAAASANATATGSSVIHWCPTSVDLDRRPVGTSGECGGMCVQHDYVASSAMPTCEPTCPAAGSTATPITTYVDRVGWGGDAGFRDGAPYRFVLYAYAHHMRARVKLRDLA